MSIYAIQQKKMLSADGTNGSAMKKPVSALATDFGQTLKRRN
jgi:hypothetical protein